MVAPKTASCAHADAVKPWYRSAPISVVTPMKPNRMPAILFAENFSSDVNELAMIKVHIGVIAFTTAASPEPISFCPMSISENGMTLFNNPIKKMDNIRFRSFGNFREVSITKTHNVIAARNTLRKTTVKGGHSIIRIRPNRNDPPQIRARKKIIAQSLIETSGLLTGLDSAMPCS